MKLALIVAVAENGVIGRDNRMPWHLPDDLKYFKRVTLGKPVIMGRKTFESIGKPLANRINIVVTRQHRWSHPGVQVVNSVDEAISQAEIAAQPNGAEEAVVIGGAQLYAESLHRVDKVYLTEVHHAFAGDTFFPPLASTEWRELSRENYVASGDNAHKYSLAILTRVT